MAMGVAMPTKDRLRRVVILCCSFARNLAYYRVGRQPEYGHLFDPAANANANFWRATNGNFIDICVLEWCKLFADKQGKHYWRKIVTDADGFEAALLQHLGLDTPAFQTEIDAMRSYRDKFLAHLDSDYAMNIPKLDIPKKAVWFYHNHVVTREAEPGDLEGYASALEKGYDAAGTEAGAVYERNS